MECKKCRKQISGESVYCEYCGVKLSSGIPRLRLIIIAAICIALLAVQSSVWFFVPWLRTSLNKKLTQDDLIQIESVNLRLDKMRGEKAFSSSALNERAEIVMKTILDLADMGLIEKDNIRYNKEDAVITYYFKCGVMACETFGDSDPLLSKTGAVLDRPKKSRAVSAVGAPTDRGSPRGLILIAMSDRKWAIDRCQALKKNWEYFGVNTDLISDVTLDDLARLNGYDFVCFNMHGFCFEWGQAKKGTISIPWICLEQRRDTATDKKYETDLLDLGLGYNNGRYMISAGFFKNQYKSGDLAESIFFFGCCEILGRDGEVNETWADVLTGLSAGAVVGVHNSVPTGYIQALVGEFMNSLVGGGTVREALDDATNKYGANDVYWMENIKGWHAGNHNPAYPLLFGDVDAKLKNHEKLKEIGCEEDLMERFEELSEYWTLFLWDPENINTIEMMHPGNYCWYCPPEYSDMISSCPEKYLSRQEKDILLSSLSYQASVAFFSVDAVQASLDGYFGPGRLAVKDWTYENITEACKWTGCFMTKSGYIAMLANWGMEGYMLYEINFVKIEGKYGIVSSYGIMVCPFDYIMDITSGESIRIKEPNYMDDDFDSIFRENGLSSDDFGIYDFIFHYEDGRWYYWGVYFGLGYDLPM